MTTYGLAAQRETPYMADRDNGLKEILEQQREALAAEEKVLREQAADIERKLVVVQSELRVVDSALNSLRSKMLDDLLDEVTPRMTIKEGVLRVLAGAGKGLSAMDILRRLNTDLGMNYERTSLSPQLSRLKREGKIDLNGNVWSLVRK